MVWIGEEADKICDLQHAAAFTLNENTVVFKNNPSRATVFEELIHLWQYKNKKCDGSELSRIECEIAAKEKILKNALAYKLTDGEIVQTGKLLEMDREDLREYYERRNMS